MIEYTDPLAPEDFLKALPEQVTVEGDYAAHYVRLDGKLLDIRKSQKVRLHSEDFAWAYGGSGPAQFALAFLLCYVDIPTARRYYQSFKFGWISGLPHTDFKKTINLRQIMREILIKEGKIPTVNG